MAEGMGFEFRSLDHELGCFSREGIGRIAVEHYKTGFDKLDVELGGGLTPGLTVLGALPGLGKSTFIFQTALHIAAAGIPVLVFSMEMSKAQIAAKLISCGTFLDGGEKAAVTANDLMNREKTGLFDAKKWKAVEKANDGIRTDLEKLYIIEREESEAKAGRVVEITETFIGQKGQKPVVIVDYLQILNTGEMGLNDKQATDKNIAAMSALALKHQIPVVLISSISRAGYKGEITMASFKESGSIEYTADTLLAIDFVQKSGSKNANIEELKKKNPRKVKISLLKQRFGRSGAFVVFDYYAKYDCFMEEKKPQHIGKNAGKDTGEKTGGRKGGTTLEKVRQILDAEGFMTTGSR